MKHYLAKASLIPYHQTGFDPVVDVKDFRYRDLISEFDYGFRISVSLLFSGVSILFAGSVFFRRFALVKTLIISAIIIGIVFLTFVLFSHLFFSDITYGFNNILEEQVFKWRFGRYNIFRIENRFGMKMFWSGFGYLTWLFFLALAYFKLKEKEV